MENIIPSESDAYNPGGVWRDVEQISLDLTHTCVVPDCEIGGLTEVILEIIFVTSLLHGIGGSRS